MKPQILYPIGLALALIPLALTAAVSQPSSRSWFEGKPLTNWNRPAATIPKAPKTDYRLVHCHHQLRDPVIPEERAVKAAGWILFNGRGETQSAGGVVLVKGQESYNFDGMCRPLGYQQFVFVNGVFAGTISPNLMNSRSEGNLIQTDIQTPSRLRAVFTRYTAKDPTCCASKASEVTYRIDIANNKPLVVPIQVRTYANPR